MPGCTCPNPLSYWPHAKGCPMSDKPMSAEERAKQWLIGYEPSKETWQSSVGTLSAIIRAAEQAARESRQPTIDAQMLDLCTANDRLAAAGLENPAWNTFVITMKNGVYPATMTNTCLKC